MSNSSSHSQNPLLQKSQLPHQAFPFDLLKREHFKPALKTSIEDAKKSLDQIRHDTTTPTFENTILALETSSDGVGRVSSIFFNLLSSESDEELQLMAREISPELANF